MNDPDISKRKTDHIQINLEKDVDSGLTTGLEQYVFIHEALPEFDLGDVDTSLKFFGKQLHIPLMISSMTGGTAEAAQINQRLAAAAQSKKVALGLGSMRAALVRPETASSYQVRSVAPDILLFANFGAVQLNYDYGVKECQRLVDLAEADALILHLNPLQEALQPEGDTRFFNLLPAIETVCKQLSVPVVVKEVGWGISASTARRLADIGVAAVDVAGAGGTSWSQVEKFRIQDERRARVAAAFKTWGIPTAQAVRAVADELPGFPLIASGGLHTGIDIAKCLALGARLGGIARPFLKAAVQSSEAVESAIEEIEMELRICMFASGAQNLHDVDNTRIAERR